MQLIFGTIIQDCMIWRSDSSGKYVTKWEEKNSQEFHAVDNRSYNTEEERRQGGRDNKFIQYKENDGSKDELV